MSKPLVAIVTANSNSGSSCIKELVEKYNGKVQIRAVFRSEEKAKPFRAEYPKLEIVTGVDASKPETLKKAFENAQYALIVTPHAQTGGFSNDANLTETMINQAVANGVKYIVLVGSWTVRAKDQIKLISSRFVSPEALLEKLGAEKGLKWTVLRGGFFMENLLNPQVKQSISQSTFNYPKVYLPMVDTRDIGKSAAACLGDCNIDKHNGKKYEMNGPELLTSEEIAKIIGKVLGKEIKYQETPKDILQKNMPEVLWQAFEYVIDNGKQAIPFTQDVKNLTGQHGSFERFLIDHKSYFN